MKTHKSHWSKAQIAAYNASVKRGDLLAFYCSDQYGRPSNGGSGTVCEPLTKHKEANPRICERGLHATIDSPHRWQGCRVWVVALRAIACSESDKTCAGVRLVIGEVLPEECIDPRVRVRLMNLSRANLSGANLSRAYLSGADLSGADLSRANLSGANLSRAYLSRADLSGANLSRAYLSRADLYGADLSRANISGANLSRADLYGANISGANLSRADLYGATFTLEDAVKAGAINANKAVWS